MNKRRFLPGLLLGAFASSSAAFAAPVGGPAILQVASNAPEPYPVVGGGAFSGPAVAESPDPLVTYRWPAPQAADGLQLYSLKAGAVQADRPASFANLGSLTGPKPAVTVGGTGSIRLDFGRESAGWLEFDSPDLDGSVEMSISEYNEPAIVNAGPSHPRKTAVPVRHGNTYRLELNDALYEGVRFGWIHVRTFGKPWHITAVRLVCQAKPANYTGSFSCSDPELTRIWYTGAYTVRLNFNRDYFGAILMDRGDRISWTGDAYPAQAAALAAFGDNLDFVKANLAGTSNQANGIASYPLYWILSLVDYYHYSGDAETLAHYIPNATAKLDAAYDHAGTSPALGFYGWDERLGAGFENPGCAEGRHAYAMLSIRAWREFARAMDILGRHDLRDKYNRCADEKIALLREDSAWMDNYGPHAAADAINAGFTTAAEQAAMFAKNFANPVTRVSYSPFNQYFIIQAMAAMNRTDAALAVVKDCWGGQLRYGGTTFFEIFDPSWNGFLGKNDAVPNAQCGYTSLCHPWGGGVVKWLTEETLGIKPAAPGFDRYIIRPHLGRRLTRVSGQVKTGHGLLAAAFDTLKGTATLTAPAGTEGEFCIPKVEKGIARVSINGQVIWDGGQAAPVPGIGGVRDDAEWLCLTGVRPGQYAVSVTYTGATPAAEPEPAPRHSVKVLSQDATTRGNWGGRYGSAGFVLCHYDEVNGMPTDRRKLPGFVKSFTSRLNAGSRWASASADPRAPAPDASNGFPRHIGCYYTRDPMACLQTMTVDIDLSDSKPHQVALYFVDWDKRGRRSVVETFDLATLERAAPVQQVTHFAGGKYLVFRCDRPVRFRINQMRGDNAVLSGIFFD